MDYLTVKEMAELKGCSGNYISRMIRDKKLEYIEKINISNNQSYYMIPVSALPKDLQSKYYAKLKKDVGLVPELKNSSETVLKQCSKDV